MEEGTKVLVSFITVGVVVLEHPVRMNKVIAMVMKYFLFIRFSFPCVSNYVYYMILSLNFIVLIKFYFYELCGGYVEFMYLSVKNNGKKG